LAAAVAVAVAPVSTSSARTLKALPGPLLEELAEQAAQQLADTSTAVGAVVAKAAPA
jgi:hypothetical protein